MDLSFEDSNCEFILLYKCIFLFLRMVQILLGMPNLTSAIGLFCYGLMCTTLYWFIFLENLRLE